MGGGAGLSERAVRRAVDIGVKLDNQAAADLAGTGLADREGDLHALSRIPASKQRVIAAICRDAPRGATLGKALAALDGRGKRPKTTTGGRMPAGAGRPLAPVLRRSSGLGAVPTKRRGGISSTGSRESGMADGSGIEWTDATWNPVTGCDKIARGCDHCYAARFAERWRGSPGPRNLLDLSDPLRSTAVRVNAAVSGECENGQLNVPLGNMPDGGLDLPNSHG